MTRAGWPGKVVLQDCVSELVHSAHRAQDVSVPGVFQKTHKIDGGNVTGTS